MKGKKKKKKRMGVFTTSRWVGTYAVGWAFFLKNDQQHQENPAIRLGLGCLLCIVQHNTYRHRHRHQPPCTSGWKNIERNRLLGWICSLWADWSNAIRCLELVPVPTTCWGTYSYTDNVHSHQYSIVQPSRLLAIQRMNSEGYHYLLWMLNT